jgi:membrane protein implicated in regulation of membrane protease activity
MFESFNLTWFWIVLGLILSALELFLPTAFAALVMGLSALIVAFLSRIIVAFSLQVAIWMGLSLIGVLVVRRFLPRQVPKILGVTQEAETLTAILPGKNGRVLYEGSSWQARCRDEALAIAPQQKVKVIDREGTTLIVMPLLK